MLYERNGAYIAILGRSDLVVLVIKFRIDLRARKTSPSPWEFWDQHGEGDTS
jgi:hypothetical protein